jgi:hypothetical protein
MSNTSANTLTIPTNASVPFPVGTAISIQQINTGLTTVAAAGGVTLNTTYRNGAAGFTTTAGNQWGTLHIRKTATDTWVVDNISTGSPMAQAVIIAGTPQVATSSQVGSVVARHSIVIGDGAGANWNPSTMVPAHIITSPGVSGAYLCSSGSGCLVVGNANDSFFSFQENLDGSFTVHSWSNLPSLDGTTSFLGASTDSTGGNVGYTAGFGCLGSLGTFVNGGGGSGAFGNGVFNAPAGKTGCAFGTLTGGGATPSIIFMNQRTYQGGIDNTPGTSGNWQIGDDTSNAITVTIGASTQAGTITYIKAGTPTIVSGFATSPSIDAGYPSSVFVTVGGSGSSSTGVIGLPTAAHGWACSAADTTTPTGNLTQMTAQNASSATFTNYSRTTGIAANWPNGDVIAISCAPH